MKLLLLLNAIATAALCAFATSEDSTMITAIASLKDGSTIKGEFSVEKINGSAVFAKNLSLNAEIVKSLSFTGKKNEAKVVLTNGDEFKLMVSDKTFKMNTSLGELDIPRKNIRTLAFSKARKTASSTAEEGLLFYCTFDDETSVAIPEVGPGGKILFDSRDLFRIGHFGKALFCPVSMTAATFLFPADFLKPAGCIEFWAISLKTRDSLRDGGDPRFFTISRESDNMTIGQLDIVNNDGGGHSGFATRTVIGSTASCESMSIYRLQQLYPDGKWYDWHHYAIAWDINGIDGFNRKIALFIDGKITPAPIESVNEKSVIEQVVSSPLRLSFSGNCNEAPMHNSKSPFLIDEFKIWNFAKTGFKEASQD